MHGAPKTPTFVRTSSEPLAGSATIHVEQPVTGWRPGDRVFLPDTHAPGFSRDSHKLWTACGRR